MIRSIRWRAGLYRWRRWLIAVAIIVAVRAALPLVLRHVIASQASAKLHARVEVGDVDLALLKGGVALKEVAVFAAGVNGATQPLIAWKLFAVQLRWLPLFQKTIRLKEVILESPHVSLERLQDGGLNLFALIPKSAGEPTPVPSPAADTSRPGWGFGVDRLVLRQGNLHFRDLMVAESEPIEITLPEIEVNNVAIRPGLYGQPSHALIEMMVDEGVLRIDTSATMRADGVAAETHVQAERLPLRRSRVYIPRVGWSDLGGTLSLELTHHIDTNGSRHDIRGTVGLQDVAVHVAGFEDAALAWRTLKVQVDPVDLVGRRATVAKVELDGLSLPVRTGGNEPLPVLRAMLRPSSAAVPPSPAAPAAPPAQPWHWSLTEAHLTDAKLLVLHNTGRFDVGVTAAAHHLAGEGDQPAAVKLTLGVGEGSVDVDGALRLTPIGFGGRVVIDKLNVPDVVIASSALSPELLPAARLAVDLKVSAGSLASTAGDVDVSGTVSVSDSRLAPPAPQGLGLSVRSLDVGLDELHLAGMLAPQPVPGQGDLRLRGKLSLTEPTATVPGSKEPAASMKSLTLTLDEVSAPGLLAKPAVQGQGTPPAEIRVRGKLNIVEPRAVGPKPKEFAVGAKSIDVGLDEVLVPNPKQPKPGPMRIRLGAIRIAAPNAQVTRTKEGIVLPQLTGNAASPPAAPQATPQPSPPAAGAGAPSMEVSVASFQLTQGRIGFSDRAVKPFYSGTISPLDVDLKNIRFPPFAANRVRIGATVAPQGTIKMDGTMNPSGGTIELNLNDVALTPFNPYASAYSSYGIGGGSLTVTTKASFSSGGYKADNTIVLHDLDVTGVQGDSLFQQNFGIPLTVALALLRDMSGNITLAVPIAADKSGMQVGIGTIVAGALRGALLGALTSPLKLIGMAVGAGGTAQAVAPPQIVFRVGRAEPTAESEEQIKQLAAFVAGRPGLGVTLEPVPSTRDVRWLREQALAAELGKPQGVWGAVKNIGQGGKRERIAQALAARAADKPGDLDEADRKTLDEWLEQRSSPSPEQLRGLAEARLTKLERVLREDYGVDASRITRGEASAEATDDLPVVRLHMGPVNKSAPQS